MKLTYPVYITLETPNSVEGKERIHKLLSSFRALERWSFSISNPIPTRIYEDKSPTLPTPGGKK
jgi:hypothetical protein